MKEYQLENLFAAVSRGEVSVTAALEQMKGVPFEVIGDFAKLDLQRKARTGFPEVIFGEGKTPDQVTQIFAHLLEHSSQGMVTRVSTEISVRAKPDSAIDLPAARGFYILTVSWSVRICLEWQWSRQAPRMCR